MGCGAVCEVQTSNSNKHSQNSKNTMLKLLPKLVSNAPLLPERQLQHFSSSLRQNISKYVLPVARSSSENEELSSSIVQKWRVVLFGLEKGDYTYQRCLGVSNEKQKLTATKQNPNTKSPGAEQQSNTQYHECFTQIEKDLNRTFDFKNQTKSIFENTLKRIANHFPAMGYTQGVNFVVGYLLILGYDERDAFWMFAHLAMSKNHLLLGLYEDGFPLANIYTLIFKNILKKMDKQLHSHLYDSLMLDDSVWIFKWFITCYLYSFPLPVVKHIWDLIIQLNGLALVYFAVALVIQLKPHLLTIDDPCDMAEFMQSLKTLSVFNEHIKIDRVVECTYEIHLTREDLSGIELLKPSFYQQYFNMMQSEFPEQQEAKNQGISALPGHKKNKKLLPKLKSEKLRHHLHLWHIKLLEERLQFMKKSEEQKQKKHKASVPEEIKEEDYFEMQKSIKVLEDIIIKNESFRMSQKTIKDGGENSESHLNNYNDYFNELIDNEPLQMPEAVHGQEIEELEETDNPAKCMTKMSYDVAEEIDQMEDESDSNHEYEISELSRDRNFTSRDRGITSLEPSIQFQTAAERQENIYNINSLIDNNNPRKISKKNSFKGSNLKIDTEGIRSGFSLAGQNILNNLSATNSMYSSVESKCSVKAKKQKENNLPRSNYNANKNGSGGSVNGKGRNQDLRQKSGPLIDFESQHGSSLERMENDNFSNFSPRGAYMGPKSGKDEYLERRTQQELMAISHCPQKNNCPSQKDPSSQIQLFNGQGLFKKKKRTYNRNSNVTTSINQDLMPTRPSHLDLKLKRSINDEESLQSVLQLSTYRKPPSQGALSSVLFQFESVK